MNPRTYATPGAYKAALESRLRTISGSGAQLHRTRQLFVFDRLLARLVPRFPNALLLKGGLALEFRLQRVRTTKDVDLSLFGAPANLLGDLQRAGREPLPDFLTFEIARDPKHPLIENEGAQYGGQRFVVQGLLAGKPYGASFGLDVSFAEPTVGEIEVITSTDYLGFVGIEPPAPRIYPVESHLAEKLHAYTLPRERLNSRIKDLPDLALLGQAKELDSRTLRAALEATFNFRKTHLLPPSLPLPPGEWIAGYAAMARENDLPWKTLDDVTKAATALLDPVLAGTFEARWRPESWSWR